ncbi:MAG: glycoside hydrolase family 125 protein [Clostridia bacterium]|nr:glycoside hydrolase family 125 protein [Clostridia bacterium]
MNIPKALQQRIDKYAQKLAHRPKLQQMYRNCCPNTLETTVTKREDGSLFVLTGDIPAMWLRDSTAQVTHYLPLTKDDCEMREIIKGVVAAQMQYICIDPYANAFNAEANGHGHTDDVPLNDPWVWERKYEIDSLCYPMRLAYLYWKNSADTSVFDETFVAAAKKTVALWQTEQRHFENSPYRFSRTGCPYHDTIHNNGMGMPVSYTGMTWSGFRPSDDACTFGYLLPSNMFAVVVLRYLEEIFTDILPDAEFVAQCKELRIEIDYGIQVYGVVDHPKFGKIYCCETDGMGNRRLFDDANVPNLISMPYLGYCKNDDPMYVRTRAFVLSEENPYYYKGTAACGVGSPHTPENYIWHIALSMQGLTSRDTEEMKNVLTMLESTDADTGFMHEGFCADEPKKFTRPWFAWSNSLFAEFVEFAVDNGIV